MEKGIMMMETLHHVPEPEETVRPVDDGHLPGVIAELGELKPGAIISEEGMAGLFHRHVVSVKRAVQRGELPPPCRLFGVNVWTAGALVRFIESRLEQKAKEIELDARRHAKLSPVKCQRKV